MRVELEIGSVVVGAAPGMVVNDDGVVEIGFSVGVGCEIASGASHPPAAELEAEEGPVGVDALD